MSFALTAFLDFAEDEERRAEEGRAVLAPPARTSLAQYYSSSYDVRP